LKWDDQSSNRRGKKRRFCIGQEKEEKAHVKKKSRFYTARGQDGPRYERNSLRSALEENGDPLKPKEEEILGDLRSYWEGKGG